MRSFPYFSVYILAISALIVGLLFSATSRAYGAEIAVVNIQKVLAESTAAKSVRDQLNAKQKSFQSELDEREKALQKENQELAKQRSVLSKEDFEKKVQEFREKAVSAQKEVAEKRRSLDKAFAQALSEIQKAISEITTAIATQKGANIAIASSQLIYAKQEFDITSEVVEQLNKQKPKVTVAF